MYWYQTDSAGGSLGPIDGDRGFALEKLNSPLPSETCVVGRSYSTQPARLFSGCGGSGFTGRGAPWGCPALNCGRMVGSSGAGWHIAFGSCVISVHIPDHWNQRRSKALI